MAMYYVPDETDPNPDPNDQSSTMEDSEGRVIESVSAMGVSQLYSYDNFGNTTSSITVNGNQRMERLTSYTANGNYIASETDALGNTMTYGINPNLGTLDILTDPLNHTTSFTYDRMQRLSGMSQSVTGLSNGTAMTNSYIYDGDQLQTISHNGFNYTFDYDVWGNQQEVKVGSQILLSNNFDPFKQLTLMTFGNGQGQTLSYNAKNQLVGIHYNGDTSDHFSYTYDVKGQLTEKRDYVNNALTKYSEKGIEVYPLNGTTSIYSYIQNDDNIVEKVNGQSVTYSQESDLDERPTKQTYDFSGNSVSNAITYDDLGRISGINRTRNNNTIFNTAYTYPTLANGKTSEQIGTASYTVNGSTKAYAYTYDASGNITAITKNGVALQIFVYAAYHSG